MFNQCITKIEWWPWWVYAYYRPNRVKYCRVIARLMFGESQLREHTARFRNIPCDTCPYCDMFCCETVSHFLFDCSNPELMAQRNESLMFIRHTLPRALNEDFVRMDSSTKSQFILSGMRSPYIHEWEEMYECLSDFMYNMYQVHDYERMKSSE